MSWPEMRTSNLKWRIVCLLLFGQVVSFVLALTCFGSSLIVNLGVEAPISQSFFTYLSLALVYGSILVYRRQKPMVSWFWYLLVGFIDVQCIFLFNKSYQYTSITSVNMLNSFSIVWVIILTWFFLGARYSPWQLFGAALSVIGLGLVLYSDRGSSSGGGSRPLLGDALVIIGTVFYSVGNVAEEFFVKNKDRVELMAMIGVYGMLVSIVEISILERKSLESIKFSTDIILALLFYTVSSFSLYSLFVFVLQMSGAAMYILSILTSNLWVVVIRIIVYHQKMNWLYFVAYSVVATGLIIYSTTGKDPHVPISDVENGNYNGEYRTLYNEENCASTNENCVS